MTHIELKKLLNKPMNTKDLLCLMDIYSIICSALLVCAIYYR